MHINNVSQKTSIKNVVWIAVICILYFAGLIYCYFVFTYGEPHSVQKFFLWLLETVKVWSSEVSSKHILIPWLVLIVLPLWLLIGFIWQLFSTYREIAAKDKYGMTLKSVDFLPGRVKFNFDQPQYNFLCGYTEINKLEMVIHTVPVRTKYGYTICVDEITLNFTVINNKHFTLKNVPSNISKFVYGVIDAGRAVENFSYCFEGAGENEDLKERIDDYLNYGLKQILPKNAEKLFIMFSIFFFGLGIHAFFTEGLTLVSWVCMFLFIVPSFIFDIFLFLDKRRERRYGKFGNKSQSVFWGKKEILYKAIVLTKIVVLIVSLCIIFQRLPFSTKNEKIMKTPQVSASIGNLKNSQKPVKTEPEVINYPKDFESLRVNQPMEYNYLTKQEIYDIRKRYVERSIFASEDYEPNEEVFGQIVDKKPWYGSSACNILNYKGDYHENIEGLSKVSAQVNNPNALVGVILIIRPWADENNEEFCNGEYNKFLPVSLSYNEKENLILAKYRVSNKFPKHRAYIKGKKYGYPLKLSGLNARDFGYKYVYASETNNIRMMYPEKLSVIDDVRMFKDFIHLGTSCNYAGGCNNISPMQDDLTFLITDLPAEINLKLWKKSPLNKRLNADFNYKIIFEAN